MNAKRYTINVPRADLEDWLDAEWPAICEQLRAEGLGDEELPTSRVEAIEIRPEGAGSLLLVLAIVFATGVAKKAGEKVGERIGAKVADALERVWARYVVPRIEQRFGRGALEETKEEEVDTKPDEE